MSSKGIKFARMEQVDGHTGQIEIMRDDEYIGSIVKTHHDLPGALSLVDTPGPVERYDVMIESQEGHGPLDLERTFEVENYSNARAALTAAKTWARAQ